MRLTDKILHRNAVIEVLDPIAGSELNQIFSFLKEQELLFDPFNRSSYIAKLNLRTIDIQEVPSSVKKVISLCDNTTSLTMGYFNAKIEKYLDPSGLIKGFLVQQACQLLLKKGYDNFYVEIGSDMQFHGRKSHHKWKIGLTNPVNPHDKVLVLHLSNQAIATSGRPQRGNPLYNPIRLRIPQEIETLTVVAPDAFDADRFSTAAYAMGIDLGIELLETLGLDAIGFSKKGTRFQTKNFKRLLEP